METEASSHTGCLIVHHIHRSVRIDEFHVIQQFKPSGTDSASHRGDLSPRKLYISFWTSDSPSPSDPYRYAATKSLR
jgi:hypothetical protein